jgi:hypothetical protein
MPSKNHPDVKNESIVSTEEMLSRIGPALDVIDSIEDKIAALDPVEMPVKHVFIRDQGGNVSMYVRSIFMPAGTVLTSRIHKTEHPYVVLCGSARVWTPDTGWRTINGPCSGITKKGTKRLIEIIEDTIWITFHPTRLEKVEDIAKEILFDRPSELDESRLVDVMKGQLVA